MIKHGCYQEWGTGYDNQTRLYYVARLALSCRRRASTSSRTTAT